MKIIVVSENGDLVRDIVEKQGHAIVAQTDDAGQLVSLILQHTPHIVFVEKTSRMFSDVDHLRATFRRIRFVLLGFTRGTSWTTTIRQALRKGKNNAPWQPETPDQRQIVFDVGYYSRSSNSKLKPSNGTQKAKAESQAFRLEWLLHTAQAVRKQAASFAEAMAAIDAYEWEEITYRTVHGSFKSPVFARDQLARSLAYLSYFVPGCDLDGLPVPTVEPANFRFLHHRSSPEIHYALFCLAIFGINPDVAKQLYRAIHWQFEGENSEELTETSIWITGLAFTMSRIGLAHATTVAWLLDPKTVDGVTAFRPRSLHRAIQTFTDWWGLRAVMDDTKRLRAVLQGFPEIETSPPFPEALKIPNYAQFLDALRSADETKPTPN